MIKEIIKIESSSIYDDEVELSWYDMQKPHLSAVSKGGVTFLYKNSLGHLHANDVLICADGYAIRVSLSTDNLLEFVCRDCVEFAKIAYQIGNRHQPVKIEKEKITTLDDAALADIVEFYKNSKNVQLTKTQGYFTANAKAHHSH